MPASPFSHYWVDFLHRCIIYGKDKKASFIILEPGVKGLYAGALFTVQQSKPLASHKKKLCRLVSQLGPLVCHFVMLTVILHFN